MKHRASVWSILSCLTSGCAEGVKFSTSDRRQARTALYLIKRLLRETQTQRMSETLELSAVYRTFRDQLADHSEALDAFFEKLEAVSRGD